MTLSSGIGCSALSLHITLTIKVGRIITLDRSHKLELVSDLCRWVCLKAHTHIFTHTHTHTQIHHPHTDLSWLIRFLSFLPVWICTKTHAVDSSGWIQAHTPSLLSLSIGLQCVGVQQCVIGFSVQLCSLKPPLGSVGESQLQQGWAWPAGGRMGGR